MKFIFADSLDYVDPRFDFINDNYGERREIYWDDQFPHEILGYAPYDGMLVSRAIVGKTYSESQAMRFRRIGAREFLRFNKPEHKDKLIFGDNGAFSYAKMSKPPYTAEDTVEFYGEGRFTHGCSVDHIIFDFDSNSKGLTSGSEDNLDRYNITLQLATEFFHESKKLGKNFTPVGVIQGWSPDSLAEAARNLVKMGYQYLAVGGLVPLSVKEVHLAVSCIEEELKPYPNIKLHLLGFAKANNLHEFTKYSKIASFDSTSPLIKAFKDNTQNYFLPDNGTNRLKFYTAIRIPQAIENTKLKNHAKSGLYKQEDLLQMENDALRNIRLYDQGKIDINSTLDAIIKYTEPLHWQASSTVDTVKKSLHNIYLHYKRTLEDRPWRDCNCAICKDIGIEVIIFRGSNRNRRRGMHNLGIYYDHLQRINQK